ncbi:Mitochondrial import inner membrane translocase subunit Tim13 [Eufriesea mexicana]|uniref:Mitochondrial import inner membrane translocase subunit n=1 Tax=Eufriesea mexicana TaxID=516756 RepID=A0A310SK30_9HYME|nr:PREDICTED: mitochondrial import inner membrane translocase subunit Tim13-like [Eufriesea mexicana]OAD56132.1 Mitochondrial import inner membrane translocase subunit Tim13 [Eufriesea mexicana]
MNALAPESLSDKEKNELMQQIKQEVAVASAQEMLSKMSEKCFKKCVVKPGTSLDSSEQKCVAMCMDRYMDAFNLVSKTYSARIQREHDRM